MAAEVFANPVEAMMRLVQEGYSAVPPPHLMMTAKAFTEAEKLYMLSHTKEINKLIRAAGVQIKVELHPVDTPLYLALRQLAENEFNAGGRMMRENSFYVYLLRMAARAMGVDSGEKDPVPRGKAAGVVRSEKLKRIYRAYEDLVWELLEGPGDGK